MAEAATTQAQPHAITWKHPVSALRDARSHLRLWIPAILGVVLDLWSKDWAFTSLEPHESRTVIPGFLELQLSLNPGALFGMGSGMFPLFMVASIAALGFVFYMFVGTHKKQRKVHAALALILAGALGNLYDRAFVQYDLVTLLDSDRSLIGHVVGDPQAETVSFHHWAKGSRLQKFDQDEIEGVRRVGMVRDFLHITPRIGKRAVWPWIFNVADVFLVIGVGLLLLSYWSRGLHPGMREVIVEEEQSA